MKPIRPSCISKFAATASPKNPLSFLPYPLDVVSQWVVHMRQMEYPVASGEWCRVVRWLQGAGFCLSQTLNLLHWVLSGGAGWPGRGRSFQGNSIFQTPRNFQETWGIRQSSALLICWHLAPRNWLTQQSRSSRGPARTAWQYPMLDAPLHLDLHRLPRFL